MPWDLRPSKVLYEWNISEPHSDLRVCSTRVILTTRVLRSGCYVYLPCRSLSPVYMTRTEETSVYVRQQGSLKRMFRVQVSILIILKVLPL